MINGFLTWVSTLLTSFADAWGWLNTELTTINGVSVTPLIMFTFVGLSSFITVAIVKWIAS